MKFDTGFLESFEESKDLVYTHASKLLTDHPDYKFYIVGYVQFDILSILICSATTKSFVKALAGWGTCCSGSLGLVSERQAVYAEKPKSIYIR
jgi:hypothetical protein